MFKFGKKHDSRPPRTAVMLKKSGEAMVTVFFDGSTHRIDIMSAPGGGGWLYQCQDLEDGAALPVNTRAEAIAQGVAEVVALHI